MPSTSAFSYLHTEVDGWDLIVPKWNHWRPRLSANAALEKKKKSKSKQKIGKYFSICKGRRNATFNLIFVTSLEGLTMAWPKQKITRAAWLWKDRKRRTLMSNECSITNYSWNILWSNPTLTTWTLWLLFCVWSRAFFFFFSICLYILIACHEGLYTSLQEDKIIPLSVTSTPILFQLLLPPSLPPSLSFFNRKRWRRLLEEDLCKCIPNSD